MFVKVSTVLFLLALIYEDIFNKDALGTLRCRLENSSIVYSHTILLDLAEPVTKFVEYYNHKNITMEAPNHGLGKYSLCLPNVTWYNVKLV